MKSTARPSMFRFKLKEHTANHKHIEPLGSNLIERIHHQAPKLPQHRLLLSATSTSPPPDDLLVSKRSISFFVQRHLVDYADALAAADIDTGTNFHLLVALGAPGTQGAPVSDSVLVGLLQSSSHHHTTIFSISYIHHFIVTQTSHQ